ncbi:MAG: hypothetical protein ABJ275_01040 [Maricaulaceae bacterium]
MSLRKLAIAGTALTAMMASTAYASVIDRPFFQVLGVVVVWGADGFDDGTGDQAPIVSDFVVGLGAAGGTDLIDGDVHTVLTGSLTPIGAAAGDIDAATFDPVTGAVSGGSFTDDGNTSGALDVSDSLSAFEIDGDTDVDGVGDISHESSFYVASNTNFEIRASRTAANVTGGLTGVNAAGDVTGLDTTHITWEMDITTSGNDGLAFGDEAQDPTGTGTGVATLASLNAISDNAAAPTTVFVGSQRTAADPGTLTQQSVRFDVSYELDTDLSTAGNQGFDLSSGVGTISSDVTYTIFVP